METLTMSMHKIGVMSQKEAIAMRVITGVTLIYLPATFVSVSKAAFVIGLTLNAWKTFFSTDIVKYQNQRGDDASGSSSIPNGNMSNGSFSEVALVRWLQVTLPLTMLTLGIGYLAFKIADRRRKREWLPFHSMGSKGSLT
jgi:hypothetical protein